MKVLAVVDFNDNSFKSVSSVSLGIEQFLNVDNRLECNKDKVQRNIEQVHQEIMETRKKIDFYINDQPNDYQDNKGKFKFLGLLTDRENDTLSERQAYLFQVAI